MSKKLRFQKAMYESLRELESSGKKITNTSVIRNARFEDGTPVGKTTLYGRNASTGAFVHAEILKEIDQRRSSQQKAQGRKTKTETLSSLRREIAVLKEENSKLIDQVVEQEARLLKAMSGQHSEKHIIAGQESELAVLAIILNHLTQNTVSDFVGIEQRYAQKFRNDPQSGVVQKDAKRYIEEINRLKLVRLPVSSAD